MVALRSKTNHNEIDSIIVTNKKQSNITLKQTVRHFLIQDSCFRLKSNLFSHELITFWLIPKSLCANKNIINDYGYSYRYSLTLEPKMPTCLFFQHFDTKHHISITTPDRNTTVRSEIYTGISLSNRSALFSSTFSTTFLYTGDDEPYFLRIEVQNQTTKPLDISLVSAKFPIVYSNCRTEEIQEISMIDSEGSRIKPENAQLLQCRNVIDELKTFGLVTTFIVLIFCVIILLMHLFGCVQLFHLCNLCTLDDRYDALKRVVRSPTHKNKNDSSDRSHSDTELLAS